MQQRQLRLGDILDDYCPRERRVTNHAIVAMIGDAVKQVRCTTCDADHDFKHAKVPRQRRKIETPAALYTQVLATGPKRVTHDAPPANAAGDQESAIHDEEPSQSAEPAPEAAVVAAAMAEETDAPAPAAAAADTGEGGTDEDTREEEEGPIHRRLIRASLPKIDGAPPPARAIPEFTIRQPAGRPANRFRGPRPARGGPGGGGGQQFPGNRSGGGTNMHGGPRGSGMRSNGGRPQGPGGAQMRRHGPPGGRKRSR